MHEAVLEDVFGNERRAFGLGGEGHVLRLHVGGEAGILLGGDVGGFERTARHATRSVSAPTSNAHAALLQLCDERAEMLGVAVGDDKVAAGDGSGDEEGSGFDAVGIDAVAGAVEFRDAVHADGRSSRASRSLRPWR